MARFMPVQHATRVRFPPAPPEHARNVQYLLVVRVDYAKTGQNQERERKDAKEECFIHARTENRSSIVYWKEDSLHEQSSII